MRKLGIYAGCGFSTDSETQIKIASQVGFDCVFIGFGNRTPDEECPKMASSYAKVAANCGIEIETIHSKFGDINSMWEGNAEAYIKSTNLCVDIAKENGIKTVVIHETIGAVAPPIHKEGLKNFEKIVSHAEKQGINLAFENLEFPRFLRAVLDEFKSPHVGFCYDCGHEWCYTPGVDYLPMYGDRLMCTHIHDNFGQNGNNIMTFDDDNHMIPFDGEIDFKRVAKMIKQTGKNVPLTLELSNKMPVYSEVLCFDFIKRAYASAVKLRDMIDG